MLSLQVLIGLQGDFSGVRVEAGVRGVKRGISPRPKPISRIGAREALGVSLIGDVLNSLPRPSGGVGGRYVGEGIASRDRVRRDFPLVFLECRVFRDALTFGRRMTGDMVECGGGGPFSTPSCVSSTERVILRVELSFELLVVSCMSAVLCSKAAENVAQSMYQGCRITGSCCLSHRAIETSKSTAG